MIRSGYRGSAPALSLRTHIELELPSPAIAGNKPQFQHARFGHETFQRDLDTLMNFARQKCLDRRKFFQRRIDVFNQGARQIVGSFTRLKESELRPFPNIQDKL